MQVLFSCPYKRVLVLCWFLIQQPFNELHHHYHVPHPCQDSVQHV
jgi:hypothetical protein